MITKRTVLILGAGSNVHLGYPLGTGLVSEICSRARAKLYSKEVAEKFSPEQIETFWKRLSRSGFPSIDAFLEHNPSDSELGRSLIADCLKQHEVEDGLFPPNDPGWYRNLFTALATPNVGDLAKAPLAVITFNYDRSLEVFLYQSIKYRYNLSDQDACRAFKSIPIIHPHGILGDYPDVPYKTSLDGMPLSSIADNITIIYELRDSPPPYFCNAAFSRGNKALEQAERIVFLGFGFHDDNIRRFRFFSEEALKGKQVIGTLQTSQMRRAEILERLKQYGLTGLFHISIEDLFDRAFDFI